MALAAAYSLNQLLLAIGQFLRDARLYTASNQSGSPSELIVRRLAVGTDNRYKGSEVWVWDMPPDATGSNPFYVNSSTGAGGVLGLSEPVGPTPFPVGTRAVLQNIGGKGFPHDQKEWALQMALAQDNPGVPATVTIASPDSTTYWNAVPAGIRSITRVQVIDGAGNTLEVGPGVWQEYLDIPGRRIYLPFNLSSGYTYLLTGRADLTFPWSGVVNYNTVLQVDPSRLVKEAIQWLHLGARDARGQDIAANLYNDRLRTVRDHPWPNEVFLG